MLVLYKYMRFFDNSSCVPEQVKTILEDLGVGLGSFSTNNIHNGFTSFSTLSNGEHILQRRSLKSKRKLVSISEWIKPFTEFMPSLKGAEIDVLYEDGISFWMLSNKLSSVESSNEIHEMQPLDRFKESFPYMLKTLGDLRASNKLSPPSLYVQIPLMSEELL